MSEMRDIVYHVWQILKSILSVYDSFAFVYIGSTDQVFDSFHSPLQRAVLRLATLLCIF
jgi:hypothetical protein